MADTDSSRQGLKLLTLHLQTNTSSEARLFSNFCSIAVCPQPDGQSAYARLKRKREMLSLPAGSQRRSTACPVPDTFLLCHCCEPPHPPPLLSNPKSNGSSWQARVHAHISLNAFHKYLCQQHDRSWQHVLCCKSDGVRLQVTRELPESVNCLYSSIFTALPWGFNCVGKTWMKGCLGR